MPRVGYTLIGYFGYQNTGDEWILHSFIKAFRTAHPKDTLRVWSGKHTTFIPSPLLKKIARYRLLNLFWCIFRSKAVIFPGGSIFQDKTSISSIFAYTTIVIWATLMRTPVIFLGQGVGPLENGISIWLTEWAFRRGKSVFTRDPETQRWMKTHQIQSKLGHDMTFLNPLPIAQDRETPWKIGLNCKASFPYSNHLRTCFDKLPDRKQWIRFSETDDFPPAPKKAIAMIHAFLPAKGMTPLFPNVPITVLVTMRYHGAVWAIQNNIPFIAISDDPKLIQIASEAGMPFTDPKSVTYPWLLTTLQSLKDNYLNLKAQIQQTHQSAQSQAKQYTQVIKAL